MASNAMTELKAQQAALHAQVITAWETNVRLQDEEEERKGQGVGFVRTVSALSYAG